MSGVASCGNTHFMVDRCRKNQVLQAQWLGVAEDVLEHRATIHSETLELYQEQQEQRLTWVTGPTRWPRGVREACIHLIGEIGRRLAVDPDAIQTAVANFDRYESLASPEVAALPSVTATICKLTYKASRMTRPMHHRSHFSSSFEQGAAWLATWLHLGNFVSLPISSEQQRIREVDVAKTMEWALEIPTVDLWLQALSERWVAVVENDKRWEKFFFDLRSAGHELMCYVSMRMRACEFLAGDIAIGIIIQGLATAGLLSQAYPSVPCRTVFDRFQDVAPIAALDEGCSGEGGLLAELEVDPYFLEEMLVLVTDRSVGELQALSVSFCDLLVEFAN